MDSTSDRKRERKREEREEKREKISAKRENAGGAEPAELLLAASE